MRALVLSLVLSLCLSAWAQRFSDSFLDENLEAISSRRASLRGDSRRSRPSNRRDPEEPVTPVPILKQINEHNDDGSYTYGYEAADGTFKIETRFPDGLVQGKYGYLDEDTGELTVIEYGADSLGFKPGGDLPEGIVVPEVVVPEDREDTARDAFDRPINPKDEENENKPSLVVRNRARGQNSNRAAEPSQRRGQNVRRPIVEEQRPEERPVLDERPSVYPEERPVLDERPVTKARPVVEQTLEANTVYEDHTEDDLEERDYTRQQQQPRRANRPAERPLARPVERKRPVAVAIGRSELVQPRRASISAAAAAAAAGVRPANANSNFPAFSAGRRTAPRLATPTRAAPRPTVEETDPVAELRALSSSRSGSRSPVRNPSRPAPSSSLNSVRPAQARPSVSSGNKFSSFPARDQSRATQTAPRRAPPPSEPRRVSVSEPRRAPAVTAEPRRALVQPGVEPVRRVVPQATFEEVEQTSRPRLAPQPRRSFAAVPERPLQAQPRPQAQARPQVRQPQRFASESDFDSLVQQFSANIRSQPGDARQISFNEDQTFPTGELTQSSNGFRLVQHF